MNFHSMPESQNSVLYNPDTDHNLNDINDDNNDYSNKYKLYGIAFLELSGH